MSFRKFVDRSGNGWIVRPRGRSEWHFEPLQGNSQPTLTVRAPSYQNDPYELSQEELQRLFDSAAARAGPSRPSPFKD
jgi:hypothetical protein